MHKMTPCQFSRCKQVFIPTPQLTSSVMDHWLSMHVTDFYLQRYAETKCARVQEDDEV